MKTRLFIIIVSVLASSQAFSYSEYGPALSVKRGNTMCFIRADYMIKTNGKKRITKPINLNAEALATAIQRASKQKMLVGESRIMEKGPAVVHSAAVTSARVSVYPFDLRKDTSHIQVRQGPDAAYLIALINKLCK